MKKYSTKVNGKKIWLIPVVEKYLSNDSLAIILYTKEYEEYCLLTTNIDVRFKTTNNRAYIDVNNYDWLESFVVKNKLGKPTGNLKKSGFCLYPEYEFDLSKLNQERKEK